MVNRVFITGIDGFIGKHVCDDLMRRGIDFYGISDSEKSFAFPKKKKNVSILDRLALKKVLEEYKPDAILHLAAIASATYENATSIYEINVCGSENLLEAVKASCPVGTPILLTSTAGVYGNQKYDYYEENLPYSPVNHYSYSKMVMELLSKNYKANLDIKIVRPFNMIGIGQNEDFIAPKLVKAFSNRQRSISLGNIDAIRDYTDVNLCAYAMVEFLITESTDYQVLNICSGKGHSVRDVFEILVSITGFRPDVSISDNIVRNNEIWRLVGSNSRLSDLLEGKFTTLDLNTILKNMLDDTEKLYDIMV